MTSLGEDTKRPGVLLISLDLELRWGIRDLPKADERWRENLIGAREAVHATLDVFREAGIAATWAVVGFLFARGKTELTAFSPRTRPHYADPRLDPYLEPVGEDEDSDLVHYAESLVQAIGAVKRQEIGTHTFSHYYCLAKGQDYEAFRADTRSAVAIASRYGMHLRSMVFPRNQHNPTYDRGLRDFGIISYRGPQPGCLHRAALNRVWLPLRMVRFIDAYIPVAGGWTTPWSQLVQPSGLCNIPGNLFLRPYSPRLRHLDSVRLARIERAMRRASIRGEILHLWWHPENFAVHLERNILFLRSVLNLYERYHQSCGLQSLNMGEIADMALFKNNA